jgi:hypothetical protein
MPPAQRLLHFFHHRNLFWSGCVKGVGFIKQSIKMWLLKKNIQDSTLIRPTGTFSGEGIKPDMCLAKLLLPAGEGRGEGENQRTF